MSNSSSNRNAVLRSVRANLARDANTRTTSLPSEVMPGPIAEGSHEHHFAQQVNAVGGSCTLVNNPAEARKAVHGILQTAGATDIIVSDGPLAIETCLDWPADRAHPEASERVVLFRADAGVTEAQWGIAETGTLVLSSTVERHRLASLVPSVHVAILPATRIVATMGSALERIQADEGLSHAVTFITGPSRTADIELQLVVGVHGPKELHVIIIEDR